MENGYIKLWRKFRETSFYRDSHCVHLAVHLLLECNHKPVKIIIKQQEKTIDRGQIFTSLSDLSTDTGISIRSLRTCIGILENVGFSTSETTNEGRLISIVKYGDYQDKPTSETTNDRQTTDKRPTSLSYKKNDKNDKNTTITPEQISLPEFINPTTWQAYLDMRKAKKAKATDHAQALIIRRLTEWHKQGHNINAVIEQSIRSNWTDIYPLKAQENAPQGNGGANPAILTDLEKQVLLMYKKGKQIQGDDNVYIEHNAKANKEALSSLVAALGTFEAIKAHLIAHDAALTPKGYNWTLKSAAKAAWEAKTCQ